MGNKRMFILLMMQHSTIQYSLGIKNCLDDKICFSISDSYSMINITGNCYNNKRMNVPMVECFDLYPFMKKYGNKIEIISTENNIIFAGKYDDFDVSYFVPAISNHELSLKKNY